MKRCLLFIATILAMSAPLRAEDFAAMRQEVVKLGQLTASPARQPAQGYPVTNGMRAIFYDAVPWQGKTTKVFAWLGLPKNRVGKVPGVVLVHGGGGTAFKEWVQKWNDCGFAAISIAVEGQTDRRVPKGTKTESNPMEWERHAWAGPARVGIYGDSAAPLMNQWMYNAVAETVLANSLLRSLPEVDADKVGLMGISWGGVITSTVIGIDPRFAFAIPVYGCGHLYDNPNQYGKALGNNQLYREVWDPMVWLPRARMPAFWFTDLGDQHFALDCQADCYRAAPGPHMVSLVPGMTHSHDAGWNPPDSYAFAQSIVHEGKPWCVQTGAAVQKGLATVSFAASKILSQATLVSTTGTGFTGSRTWTQSQATLEKDGTRWLATAPLPKDTTAWFVNVTSGKLVASSDYQEIKAQN